MQDQPTLMKILDGQFPNFQGELMIEARHPHWHGLVCFDVALKRARLVSNGQWASFSIENHTIVLGWDFYPVEHFRLEGRQLVYVDVPNHNRRETVKVAIVTAYHLEPPEVIKRCTDSVRNQSYRVDHILVADGHPQDWIDDLSLRQIKLDRAHGDYGNTPRGVGALLAISEDYDAIGFLDADNWLETDHVSSCLSAAHGRPDADLIIAKWNLRRPDGTIIKFPAQPEHVDTNCFFFLQGSFHIIPHFSLMNKELSCIGDRIFYAAVRAASLKSVTVNHPTVNYHCLWSSVYNMIGETPPPNAKPSIDSSRAEHWLRGRTARHLEYASRRAGVKFANVAGAYRS